MKSTHLQQQQILEMRIAKTCSDRHESNLARLMHVSNDAFCSCAEDFVGAKALQVASVRQTDEPITMLDGMVVQLCQVCSCTSC